MSRQIIHRQDAVSPVIATILLVAITVILAAVLYLTVTALFPPAPNRPIALGATIGTTGNGLNYTVSFVSVPLGLSAATTYFSLQSTSGAFVLANTPLSSLPGAVVNLTGTAGKLYIQYRPVTSNQVSAGDAVLIGTTLAGSTSQTRGFTVQISTSTNVLFTGLLS